MLPTSKLVPTSADLSTFKVSLVLKEPLISNVPLISVSTLISNPKFGEITASAEPDLILSISPIESALIFVIPLPSPLITPPTVKDSDTFNAPLIDVSTFTFNPLSGETTADAEPLIILEAASAERASVGISYKPTPLPVN